MLSGQSATNFNKRKEKKNILKLKMAFSCFKNVVPQDEYKREDNHKLVLSFPTKVGVTVDSKKQNILQVQFTYSIQ
jgi:hypothetical protein